MSRCRGRDARGRPTRVRDARCLLAAALAVGCLFVAAFAEASGALRAEPRLQLRGDLRLPPGTGAGVARLRGGWIVSGTDTLVRLDDALEPVLTATPAIPEAWKARGYTRLGADVDLAGDAVYVPLERPDGSGARQAVARYDAGTLQFVDAIEVEQPDMAFVAVDARSGIAYSMAGVGSTELLRYDIADEWRPLPPLGLGRRLEAVRGGDVAAGGVWLSTDDDRHRVYEVDRGSGVVRDLGSAGHFDGTIGGIDATRLGSSRVHVAATDANGAVLTGFGLVGDAPGPIGEGQSGWPPVLVMGAMVLVAAAGGASAVLVYRAWVGLRPRPSRRA